MIPADGKLSLREAITVANTTAGADMIVLPAGVFKITLAGAGENGNATGDFDITGTVTIRGAGAGLTIIDGQQLDRVFDVAGTAPSSIKVVLQRLTVRNGNVTGHGGGIRVGNADLVVRDCVVTGNRASAAGGGISNGAAPGTGNVTLVRTTVARNVAGTNGGGICRLAGSQHAHRQGQHGPAQHRRQRRRRHRRRHGDADQQHRQRQHLPPSSRRRHLRRHRHG